MAEDYASISDSFIFGYLLRFVFIGDNNNAYYYARIIERAAKAGK